MAAKRTVDPTGSSPSTKMVSMRLTANQLSWVETICKARGWSRSALFRLLLDEEVQRVEGTSQGN
jgi:hypothetical protein